MGMTGWLAFVGFIETKARLPQPLSQDCPRAYCRRASRIDRPRTGSVGCLVGRVSACLRCPGGAMKVSYFETARYAVPPTVPAEWPVPPGAYDPDTGAQAYQ